MPFIFLLFFIRVLKFLGFGAILNTEIKMIIETNRLILRNYKMRDLVDYIHLMTQEKVASRAGFSMKTNNRLVAELKSETENKLKFAIELKETGKIIGEIGFVGLWANTQALYGINKDQNAREVEFCLSEEHWNKGYMTEALESLIKVGFEEFSLDTIVGACYSKNAGCKKVKIKCGLIPYKTDPNHIWNETGETCKVVLSKITKEQYKHIDKYKKLNIRIFDDQPYAKTFESINKIINSSTDVKEL